MALEPEPRGAGLDWGGYAEPSGSRQFIPPDYYRNVRLDRRGNLFDPLFRREGIRLYGCTPVERAGDPGTCVRLERRRATGRQARAEGFGWRERAWARYPAPGRGEGDEQKSSVFFREACRVVSVLGQRELPGRPGDARLSYRHPTSGLKAVDGECLPPEIRVRLRYTTDGSEPTSGAGPPPIPLRVRRARGRLRHDGPEGPDGDAPAVRNPEPGLVFAMRCR